MRLQSFPFLLTTLVAFADCFIAFAFRNFELGAQRIVVDLVLLLEGLGGRDGKPFFAFRLVRRELSLVDRLGGLTLLEVVGQEKTVEHCCKTAADANLSP